MPNPRLSQVMAETARTRHSGQSGTLAFLTTEPVNDLPTARRGKILPLRHRTGKHLRLSHGSGSGSWTRACPPPGSNHILWARGIEGLIIPNISAQLFTQGQRTLPIEWEKFCVIEIGGSMLQPDVNRVRHDHYGAMIKALHRLETTRLPADRAVHDTRGGPAHPTTAGARRTCSGGRCVRRWRTLKPLLLDAVEPKRVVEWARKNRLDAVLSPGGDFLHALRAGGMDVPGEIGFASLDIFGRDAATMSGIDQDPSILARSAVDMLVTLIHRRERGVPEHPTEMLSVGHWQKGETIYAQRESAALPDPDDQMLDF